MDKGAMTRRKIIEASVELLGREGPDGFSAAALAREAGVSKATIFHHFDSLAEIPEVALEELFVGSMARSDDPALNLSGYLTRVKDDALDVIHSQRGFINAYFVFLTKALFDPQLRLRFVAGAMQMHDALRAGLEPRLPKGTHPEETDEIARLIGAALDGVALHHLVMEDHERLDRGWDLFMDMLQARYGSPPTSHEAFSSDT
jgi:AcrR family transcriptional regulator